MATTETLEGNIREEVEQLRSGAEQAKQRFSRVSDKIKTQTEKAWDDLIETVKKHPGKSIGITLAAGFAVGALAAAGSRRRYSATSQVKDLAGSGAEAWNRLRSGFEDAACSLKDAVDDAVKKFK